LQHLNREDFLSPVLSLYGISNEEAIVTSYGKGLINHTWKVSVGQQDYILQRINEDVFKNPRDIAYNIRLLSNYLQHNFPAYHFVAPITANKGKDVVEVSGSGTFRLFPFVPGSYTYEVVRTAGEAFEAALQFGRFTASLNGFDAGNLKTTIPHFHDLSLRYTQFQTALKKATVGRLKEASGLIKTVQNYSGIVNEYKRILDDSQFRRRVTHHDTKISNVLFNKENKGICVIDLDTVMPGYFISDVGDMMRTYLSPVSEEENDYTRIEIRDDFYEAIVKGYQLEMEGHLTAKEKDYFFYAGKFMIYMQGLRFLTDYLDNDVYYGAAYEGHNLVRAGNQFCLLERLTEKESLLAKRAR
jgi:Ser/Thr protein kinase RdoA (MazF antagonist)